VLGDAAEPSAEHVPKMVYLEACFREALRLHPAVVAVARDAAADTVIKVPGSAAGAALGRRLRLEGGVQRAAAPRPNPTPQRAWLPA
jgi:hypothetical protein